MFARLSRLARRLAWLSLLAAIAGIALLLLGSSRASAFGIYTGGSSGYDISYPQCSGGYPAYPFAFGIVGVNNGRAFRHNSCVKSEFAWAQQGSVLPSLYINLNYAAGSTAQSNISSPLTCAKGDKACQSYNYGWNAAKDAWQYAAGHGATAATWWLDVETGNSWSAKTDLNVQDIKGAIAYLQGQGATVGIYSLPSMWQTITGGWKAGLPVWIAGASSAFDAQSRCGNPSYGFGGGQIWLVQYSASGFDADYACP